MSYPNLYEISWKVDEPTYRKDPALSYSTIARFAREGFNKLDNLFDEIDTPSLTFGSAVDAMITGGQQEFDENFVVAEFPEISDSLQTITKTLFVRYNTQYRNISDIPDDILADIGKECNYYADDKYKKTRVKKIKEECQEYYSVLYSANGKKVLSTDTYNQVLACVRALKESESTKKYFAPNDPFDDSLQRFYQLKFKMPLDDFEVRCMADLIIVDHKNKTIYPIDLKTSSHTEWDFYRSFVQWRYDIQARLYWRIIRYNLDQHPIFKDYKLEDYTFIVVNKNTLVPLTWLFRDTTKEGTLAYGRLAQVRFEDPFAIVRELHRYLTHKPQIPESIYTQVRNDIINWINKEMQ